MRLPPRTLVFVLGCSVAAILAACDPQPTGAMPAQPSPPEITSASGGACAPPVCDRVGGSVKLTWRPTSSPITGYRVLRDGEEIASLPPIGPASTSVRDRSAIVGATYRYEVVAVAANGARAPSGPEEVTVPMPPVRAAQLEGTFRVVRTVRRVVNLRELEGIREPRPGLREPARWSFEASCPPAEGACRVRWNGQAGWLTPTGTVYRGRSSGGYARCARGVWVRAPIHFWIRVEAGEVQDGAWVASAIHGHFRSTFSCPGSSVSSGSARFSGALA